MTSNARDGRNYRIECLVCGATAHGGPDQNLGFDKEYHRGHHCPGAEFEVKYRD